MHSYVWKCSYKDITLIFTSIKWKFLFCTVRYPHMIPLNYSQEKYVVTTLSLSLSSTHYESAHLDVLEEGTKSGYWMWNKIFLQKWIWIVIKYLHVHYLNCLCSRNATKWQKYNKYLLLFYWPSILPECCNMLHIHITIGRKYESLLVL